MNKISVCMIVRDEENNMEKCLGKISGYVDEIVVVDTGSLDKTKEISSKFTDKIYDFEWCDDFSKARNFSIQNASNDWVLILDADEIVAEFDRDSLESLISKDEYLVGRIKRVNIFEDQNGIKRYIERVSRFFNRRNYKYNGSIHEQIVSNDGREYTTSNIEITADHIGYMKDVVKNTNKIERNLKMLEESIKKDGSDPYLYYQLGKTYYMDKKYEDAYVSFKNALDIKNTYIEEYAEDLVITYGYSLINTGRYKEALEMKEYEGFYGEVTDYKFLMALIYMNNARFENAVNEFLSCIGEKEGSIEGINSYLAYYNVGIIYECLGFKEEAKAYYEKCGNYPLAINRIENMS